MVNVESPIEICLTKHNEHPLPWLIAEMSNRTSVIRQNILSTVNVDSHIEVCLTDRNELPVLWLIAEESVRPPLIR